MIHRSFRAAITAIRSADGATIKTATFDGALHQIYQVVAMVGDSVVWPIGAEGPEFVPKEVLAVAPGGWDGRPCVPDHPNGGTASANTPVMLESRRVGLLFNSRYEDGKLKTEAWIDPGRQGKVGPDAADVLTRLAAGETVEVSVGAWVTTDPIQGEHDGQSYEFVWREVVPDHLALLTGESVGACSNEMGCGARAAGRIDLLNQDTDSSTWSCTPSPFWEVRTFSPLDRPPATLKAAKEKTMSKPNLWTRLLAGSDPIMRTALVLASTARAAEPDADGTSDADLRDALHMALNAEVPGFDWILEVFPDTETVVYSTVTETMQLWQRTYALDGEGKVTLSDDAEEVEQKTQYVPISAAGDGTPDTTGEPTAAAGCECKNQGDGKAARAQTKGVTSMSDKVKDLVGRLIAAERSPFGEDDRTALEGFPEERLTELVARYEKKPEKEPKTAQAEPQKADPPRPMSEDEWLAAAPADVRSLVERSKAEEAKRRAGLIAAIRKADESLSAEDLAGEPTPSLERLAALAAKATGQANRPTDYRGLEIPDPSGGEDLSFLEPPDAYGLNKQKGAN